jgi:hypothetical protein
MTTPQGADERRIRRLLTARGVSYADPPPAPPRPVPSPAPAGDWWDRLYDDAHPDHHTDPTAPAAPPAAPRLPNWRKGETTADLHGDDPDNDPDDSSQDDDPDGDTEWDDIPDTPADKQPPPRRPARARRPAPANRATQAYAELPGRTRWLLYNGIAAAGGYWLGLVPLMESWLNDCGHDNGPTAAIILGVGLIGTVGVLIDRRTRDWWGPLPELCRIPLASAVLALLLYAPGAAS